MGVILYLTVLNVFCCIQVGGVTPNQTAVFEEFAKSIPGFITPVQGESLTNPAVFPNQRTVFEQGLHNPEVNLILRFLIF